MKLDWQMEKLDGLFMKRLAFISLILPMILIGQDAVALDESFSPTSLNDWGETKVRIEKIKSLKDYYAGRAEMNDAVALEKQSDFVFRVQLGSTSDYEEAIAFEERAAMAFEEELLIRFDSPYYKIRLGKMNNREDAQKLQQAAIQKGYRRAWVIRAENTPQLEN